MTAKCRYRLYVSVQDTDADDLPAAGHTHTELYHMEIHRNKEWTKPVVTANNDKAEVVFDETLHVRTWIDGGMPFAFPT